jgi:hypothetical protein
MLDVHPPDAQQRVMLVQLLHKLPALLGGVGSNEFLEVVLQVAGLAQRLLEGGEVVLLNDVPSTVLVLSSRSSAALMPALPHQG